MTEKIKTNAFKAKYLLTGANGFLGAQIRPILEKNGIQIIGLGRSTQNLNIDISRPFDIDSNIEFDVIIHAAGKAHTVPTNEAEEKIFFDVNFEGTKNLCKAISQLQVKPKAFIFISTVAVYGLDSGELINEDHPLSGATPYAKSKISAEIYLNDWAQINNITLGVLRLPLIAGPKPPGNLGAMIKGIKSGKYFRIGTANTRKSMVWAEDIHQIISILAEVGGVFNLTDGMHPTFKELENTIAKAYNKKEPLTIPMTVAKLIGKFGDLIKQFPVNSDKLNKITSTLTFDDTKARKLLGWKPNYVLDKLRDTL